MYTFMSIVIFIVAILLVLIVLVQNSKGGGLASGFSSSNQVLGVRKTTDFLEKFTWGLTATLVVLCVCISFVGRTAPDRTGQSEIQQQTHDAVIINNQMQAPDFGTAQPSETQVPEE